MSTAFGEITFKRRLYQDRENKDQPRNDPPASHTQSGTKSGGTKRKETSEMFGRQAKVKREGATKNGSRSIDFSPI
ncbi:hypothetical protein [Brevibacillus marinus]|uniref:hypothetical protein n=1 Tax=Brevibacillus marinus TaxID=2496837 RepID=UPI0013DFD384